MNKEKEIYLFIKNSNRSDDKFLGDYFKKLFSFYSLKINMLKDYGIKSPYETLKKVNLSYFELLILLGIFNISFEQFIDSFYNYILDEDIIKPLEFSVLNYTELIDLAEKIDININALFRFIIKNKCLSITSLADELNVDERRLREELINKKNMNVALIFMLNKKFNLTLDELKYQYDLYCKMNSL